MQPNTEFPVIFFLVCYEFYRAVNHLLKARQTMKRGFPLFELGGYVYVQHNLRLYVIFGFLCHPCAPFSAWQGDER